MTENVRKLRTLDVMRIENHRFMTKSGLEPIKWETNPDFLFILKSDYHEFVLYL